MGAANLNGVWGSGPNDVWAVGGAVRGGGIIVHWNAPFGPLTRAPATWAARTYSACGAADPTTFGPSASALSPLSSSVGTAPLGPSTRASASLASLSSAVSGAAGRGDARSIRGEEGHGGARGLDGESHTASRRHQGGARHIRGPVACSRRSRTRRLTWAGCRSRSDTRGRAPTAARGDPARAWRDRVRRHRRRSVDLATGYVCEAATRGRQSGR
jgi:hypothetical protein